MSNLPVITEIFEKRFSKQGTMSMDWFLPKYQCGFRKGYIAQHCPSAIWDVSVFGVALVRIFPHLDTFHAVLTIVKYLEHYVKYVINYKTNI